MRFNFVAKVDFNGQNAKVPGFREINTAKAHGISMNLTAIAEQNNRAYLEVAGFKNDQIKTMDTENNKIEISWDDRFDVSVMNRVANYRKNVIVLDGDRHEFIAEYDFINFVRDHLDEIKGKVFTITGQVRKNEYNGKITDRFQLQNMFEVTDERKNQLRVSGEFFFNSEGVDLADWKSEKKITFSGYTKEWMSKEHPNAYVPKTIVFDASKVDFTNERHVAITKIRLKQMGLDLDETNIKSTLKKNTYYSQNVILAYQNGAEKIEFSENELTPNQKELLDLGIKKLEDFAPAGSIYGSRVQIFKLVDFDIRGDYADGVKKLDIKSSEFEEEIYTSVSMDEFMNVPDIDDVDIDDLFGN